MQLQERESYLPMFQLESPSMGGVQKECVCWHGTLEYAKGRWHLFSKHILTSEGGWDVDNGMLLDVSVEDIHMYWMEVVAILFEKFSFCSEIGTINIIVNKYLSVCLKIQKEWIKVFQPLSEWKQALMYLLAA